MHPTFGKLYTFAIIHAVLGVPFIKSVKCLDDRAARGFAERQPGTIRVYDGHQKVWPVCIAPVSGGGAA